MRADFFHETVPTRAASWAGELKIREVAFDPPGEIARFRKTGRAMLRRPLANGDPVIWLSGNHLGAMPLLDLAAADPDTIAYSQRTYVGNAQRYPGSMRRID